MQHYEIVFLAHPEHTELLPGIVSHLKDLITSGGGNIHRFEELGRRTLAYPIKKLTKAYYILMNIEINLSTLNALKEQFKYQETILRDLIICMPEAVTTPSALFNSREERMIAPPLPESAKLSEEAAEVDSSDENENIQE